MVELAHRGLGLRRIVAGHFRDNPSSGRVLRKLGFRPTGAAAARHSVARGTAAPCIPFARDQDDAVPAPGMPALAA